VNCSNSIPTLAGINPNATQYSPVDTNYNLNINFGDTVDFNVYAFDADVPPQNLTMDWNHGIPDGIFSVIDNVTPNPTGHFHHDPFANPFVIQICFTVTVRDNFCPFMGQQTFSYCLTDTSTFSIDSYNDGNLLFTIYPNPAVETINLIFNSKPDEETTVKLYGIDGKLLQKIPVKEKNTEINVSDLPKGIYFVKLTNSEGTTFRKMIKE
jgi:hypothetical protein